MNKLVILGYPFELYKGGAEYQCTLLEKYLQNYKIVYLFPHPDTINIERYQIYKPAKFLLVNLINVYKMLLLNSPDVIYMRGAGPSAAAALLYSKLHKKKMILSIASQKDLESVRLSLRPSALKKILEKILTDYSVKKMTQIICQSYEQMAIVRDRYKNIQCKIIRSLAVKSDFSFERHTNKVAWIGNYKKLKRPELFIELASSLSFRNDIEFIMAGRLPVSINGQIGGYGCKIPHNLKIMGEISQPEVESIIAEASVLVNTSDYEGFPNTFIQAWYSGTVVVSLSVDPDGFLLKKKMGFLSGTMRQMSSDILKILDNKQIRIETAVRSRKEAEKEFDADRNAKELMKFF